MIKVKTFVFNPFQLNTYLVYNESGNGVVVDAGNYSNADDAELFAYIHSNGINIKALLLTHCHIDHILGVKSISDRFKVPTYYHHAGEFLIEGAPLFGDNYGFKFAGFTNNRVHVEDGESFEIDDLCFNAFYTPGHVDGSICYYFQSEGMLFSGDVLFRKGIGRTDLPTGDYNILEKSIRTKIYVLEDETTVFPGHGPSTTIGYEKRYNPFFQGA